MPTNKDDRPIRMDFPLWKQLLTEAVYWQEFSDNQVLEIYQRTAVAWGMGEHYWVAGVENIDLTKMLEQYKILTTLKGTHHGKEISDSEC